MVEPASSATIHLSAIRANFALACERSAGRDPIAVIKADAYGHGSVRVAQALTQAGCTRFAVATVSEAETLRDSGVRGDFEYRPSRRDIEQRCDVVVGGDFRAHVEQRDHAK